MALRPASVARPENSDSCGSATNRAASVSVGAAVVVVVSFSALTVVVASASLFLESSVLLQAPANRANAQQVATTGRNSLVRMDDLLGSPGGPGRRWALKPSDGRAGTR